MGHRTIRHTITRNGIYYVRFRLPGNKYFRKSLETDSHTQAQLLMSFASPVIPLVQRGTIQPDHFGKRLSEYGNSLKQQNEQWLAHQFLNDEQCNIQPIVAQEYREIVTPSGDEEEQIEAQPKEVLTLAGAWNMYKKEKAQNWTKAISQANERFIEVMLIVLGSSTDVTTITKQDIKQVTMPNPTEWGLKDYLGSKLVKRQTRLSNFLASLLYIPFKPASLFLWGVVITLLIRTLSHGSI